MADCNMFLTLDETICTLPLGHLGEHGGGPLAFRETEEQRFLDRKHAGKNPYGSKAEAKRIAAMTTTTFGGRAKKPYRCPICDYWHVGEGS